MLCEGVPDGGALGLASQVQLWSSSAMQIGEGRGRGHVLVRCCERAEGDERVSGEV